MTELPLLLALGFAAVVVLALRRIMQQSSCYRGLDLRRGQADGAAPLPALAVIVPARNESANIGPCLRGLADQLYPAGMLKIIAIDDDSSDDTAAIMRDCAAASDRIALLEAAPLPAGWAGKPFACWRGACADDSEWLCFIDADTIAAPELLATAVGIARARRLDFLSLQPFQELSGFYDRLVLPLGFLLIAATQRLETTPVNGQFILIRADAYFRIGGHAAHPRAICEDKALAESAKAAGCRVAVLDAATLMRTRMYRNGNDLWEGLSKNLTEIFGGPARTLAIAAAALAIACCAVLLPLHAIANVSHHPGAPTFAELAVALPTAVAVFATQIALARHFRIPFWYGLLLPLSAAAGLLLAVNAVLWKLRGSASWKGRVYST